MVTGDVGWALEELRRRTAPRAEGLGDDVRQACELAWRGIRADERTVSAAAWVEMVQRVAAGRAVVVADMCIPGYWLGGYYVPTGPRALQYPMGWGTLGFALPASVGGGGRRRTGRCWRSPVTAASPSPSGSWPPWPRSGSIVTVLVFDDGGYGMLRFDQDRAGDPHRGVDLLNPDFIALAASFGIPAVSVDGVGPELEQGTGRGRWRRAGPHLVRCVAQLYPPRTTSPRWNDA